LSRESFGLLISWIAYVGIVLAISGVALALPGLWLRPMEFLMSPALIIHFTGPGLWLLGIVLSPIGLLGTGSGHRVRRGLRLCVNCFVLWVAVFVTLTLVVVYSSGR
jgi:hypothetical protein